MTNTVATALQTVASAPEAAQTVPLASTVETTSGFMTAFANWIEMVRSEVWGLPLVICILATGLILTCRLRLLHVFNLKHAFRCMFRFAYVAMVFIGPYLTVSVVWSMADAFNGMMAFPNLVALILLSPIVWKSSKDYFSSLGKDPRRHDGF